MCSCVSAGLQCGVGPVQLPAVPVNTGQVQLGNKQHFHGVRTRDCVRQCGWSYKGTCPEWRGFPWGWPTTWSGAKKHLTNPSFGFVMAKGYRREDLWPSLRHSNTLCKKTKTAMVLLLQNEHVSKILFRSSVNERTSKMARQVQIQGAQLIQSVKETLKRAK